MENNTKKSCLWIDILALLFCPFLTGVRWVTLRFWLAGLLPLGFLFYASQGYSQTGGNISHILEVVAGPVVAEALKEGEESLADFHLGEGGFQRTLASSDCDLWESVIRRRQVALMAGNERYRLTPEQEIEFVAVGELESKRDGSIGGSAVMILSGRQLVTAAHVLYDKGKLKTDDFTFFVRVPVGFPLPDGSVVSEARILEYELDVESIEAGRKDGRGTGLAALKDWATLAIRIPQGVSAEDLKLYEAVAARAKRVPEPPEDWNALPLVGQVDPGQLQEGDPITEVAYHGDLPFGDSKRITVCSSREKGRVYQHSRNIVQYDCSNRGGSSGGPLFRSDDLQTVRALGIIGTREWDFGGIPQPYDKDNYSNEAIALSGDFLKAIYELDQILRSTPSN